MAAPSPFLSSTSSTPLTLDDFEILGGNTPLGIGKFSTVWRARSKATGSLVALKRIQVFEMENESRKECLREARLLQSLDHPNIVKCEAAFVDKNELIIVLELADSDLQTLLKSLKEPMPEPLIFHYFIQAAEAVAAMHEKRIMHRDIKPGNIFLASGDRVKLGDLGLSRYFSSKTEETRSLVGTPYYMSPELLTESGYSFKSDVWSLGCLLYEMAMLRNPFYQDNATFYTLGKKIKSCEYPPMGDSWSPMIKELVGKMIQSNPDDRPDIKTVVQMAQRAVMQLALGI